MTQNGVSAATTQLRHRAKQLVAAVHRGNCFWVFWELHMRDFLLLLFLVHTFPLGGAVYTALAALRPRPASPCTSRGFMAALMQAAAWRWRREAVFRVARKAEQLKAAFWLPLWLLHIQRVTHFPLLPSPLPRTSRRVLEVRRKETAALLPRSWMIYGQDSRWKAVGVSWKAGSDLLPL